MIQLDHPAHTQGANNDSEKSGSGLGEQAAWFSADTTFDEWLEKGQQLQHIEHSVQWWVGDWWNFGHAKFGDTAYQGVLRYREHTVRQMGYVASRFHVGHGEPSVVYRRPRLSFWIHAEVVTLVSKAPGLANLLLDRAEEEGWTQAETRLHAKRAIIASGLTEEGTFASESDNQATPTENAHLCTCPACGHTFNITL